jgi:hypothetical protein
VSSESESEEELGGMSFFNSLRLDADEENPCRLWEPSKLLLHLETPPADVIRRRRGVYSLAGRRRGGTWRVGQRETASAQHRLFLTILLPYLTRLQRGVRTRGKHMGFFKKVAGGNVVFNGGRYNGKTVDEVARLDPKYLRWARKDMTIAVPNDVFDVISAAMVANGISFTPEPKKKA